MNEIKESFELLRKHREQIKSMRMQIEQAKDIDQHWLQALFIAVKHCPKNHPDWNILARAIRQYDKGYLSKRNGKLKNVSGGRAG